MAVKLGDIVSQAGANDYRLMNGKDLDITGVDDAHGSLGGTDIFLVDVNAGGTQASTKSVTGAVIKAFTDQTLTGLSYAAPLGVDDNYVTDAQLTHIGNLDAGNTTSCSGDQTLTGLDYAAPLTGDDNYVTDAQLTHIGNLDTGNTTNCSGDQTLTGLGYAADTGYDSNRAMVTTGGGSVGVSEVTSTEIGYLDGVTSSIQVQLGTKALLGGDSAQDFLTQNLDISGTFTASGTATSINSSDFTVDDQFIGYATGNTGADWGGATTVVDASVLFATANQSEGSASDRIKNAIKLVSSGAGYSDTTTVDKSMFKVTRPNTGVLATELGNASYSAYAPIGCSALILNKVDGDAIYNAGATTNTPTDGQIVNANGVLYAYI